MVMVVVPSEVLPPPPLLPPRPPLLLPTIVSSDIPRSPGQAELNNKVGKLKTERARLVAKVDALEAQQQERKRKRDETKAGKAAEAKTAEAEEGEAVEKAVEEKAPKAKAGDGATVGAAERRQRFCAKYMPHAAADCAKYMPHVRHLRMYVDA